MTIYFPKICIIIKELWEHFLNLFHIAVESEDLGAGGAQLGLFSASWIPSSRFPTAVGHSGAPLLIGGKQRQNLFAVRIFEWWCW